MNRTATTSPACDLSNTAARQRLLSRRGEPWFIGDWMRVLMIHLEVDADALQRGVPFALDLHDGRAFVSLVAFTMENLRPRIGGQLGAWLFRPIANHHFLNVRTYVQHAGEPGIYFLAEWLSNPLAVRLGPMTFGLPYRLGHIAYGDSHLTGELHGCVKVGDGGPRLAYRATVPAPIHYAACEMLSLNEWLMERYTAFTCWRNRRRFFRIWHPAWPQGEVAVDLLEDSLLRRNWRWSEDARLMGANYSPGIVGVWMGGSHRVAEAGGR